MAFQAFHTNWTAPFLLRSPNIPYQVEPFELLTTILSALQWRAIGGSISMETDIHGAEFYSSIGLTTLWNSGVHTSLERAVPPQVSPYAFWAAGKLYALRQMPAPCVMLDTDFIVWQDIAPLCNGADVAAIHFEEIQPDIYPDISHFQVTPGFDLQALDWSIQPMNTALAIFLNAAFKDYYTTNAISFMEHASHAENPLTYMVFAEQRMLSMCASGFGAHLVALSDLPALFLSGQQYFTHVWGYKQQMRNNSSAYEAFCRRCAVRIARDFPEFAGIAAHIPCLTTYFG